MSDLKENVVNEIKHEEWIGFRVLLYLLSLIAIAYLIYILKAIIA